MTKVLGDGHNVDLDAVLFVRKTYSGMQKAILRLPIQAAKKLLEKPTIRINWSSFQICEVVKPSSALSADSSVTSRKTAPQKWTYQTAALNEEQWITSRKPHGTTVLCCL